MFNILIFPIIPTLVAGMLGTSQIKVNVAATGGQYNLNDRNEFSQPNFPCSIKDDFDTKLNLRCTVRQLNYLETWKEFTPWNQHPKLDNITLFNRWTEEQQFQFQENSAQLSFVSMNSDKSYVVNSLKDASNVLHFKHCRILDYLKTIAGHFILAIALFLSRCAYSNSEYSINGEAIVLPTDDWTGSQPKILETVQAKQLVDEDMKIEHKRASCSYLSVENWILRSLNRMQAEELSMAQLLSLLHQDCTSMQLVQQLLLVCYTIAKKEERNNVSKFELIKRNWCLNDAMARVYKFMYFLSVNQSMSVLYETIESRSNFFNKNSSVLDDWSKHSMDAICVMLDICHKTEEQEYPHYIASISRG